jgi:uronate dehydrogenase
MEGARFRRVLLTGAGGRIGSVVREGIRSELDELRLSDRNPVEPVDGTSETFARADLLEPEEVARMVEGVDAIVHLGGHADEAAFSELIGPNVHGTFNIFEAARRTGVTRIVYASSNHATGFYTPGEPLVGDEPARPDSLYGVTKVFGEALGRLYADKYGLQVIAVRIGSFEDRPREHRHLSTWLSHGDAVRLFRACLVPTQLSFLTIYGVSANTRSWWPPSDVAKLIGYEPEDDAENYAGDVAGGSEVWQGGRFALPDYGGWAG